MPWTTADVEAHKKGLNDRAKGVWVTVANKALASCLDKIEGEPSESQVSRCEASAIKQANAVAGNMSESGLAIVEVAQAAIEAARSFVHGGKELVEATGLSPAKALDALLDKLQEELDAALIEAAPTKTVSGRIHDRGDFLVTEDPEDPATWHLPVKVRGEPDHRLMGGAWAALHQGYRGQKYEGPGKQEAISKLRALYKAEDMSIPGEQSEAEAEVEEAVTPAQVVAVARWMLAKFGGEEGEEKPAVPAPPAASAEEAEDVAEVELAESASGQLQDIWLAEDDVAMTASGNPRAPLAVNIRLIRPGWGNTRDNHYYPKETIVRDAHIFEGAKMYVTDHKADEKKEPTEVSVVEKCPAYFEEDGSAIARVMIFDPNFAEKTRNRAAAGMLHTLECSILGTGKVRKGEVEGKKGKIVEAITARQAVDWVTKAGAGGQAVNLAESGGDNVMSDEQKLEEEVQEEAAQEAEVVVLSENEVTAILDESNLPSAAKDRLKAAEYENEEAVKERIAAEVEYLKTITEAGKPMMHGDRERVTTERMSEADFNAAYDDIRARHGLAPLYGGE